MVQQIIVSCKERVTDMAFKKTNEPGLVKVRIFLFLYFSVFCFYSACNLYTEIDFGVHMIHMCFWSAYDTQSLLVVEKKMWRYSTPKINQYKLK